MQAEKRVKVCFWCRSKGFRRVNRTGFLRRHLLPLFGFFPWECMTCRRKSYFRDDGHIGGSGSGV
jgi:hypothetical protein